MLNLTQRIQQSPRYKWWAALAISVGTLVDASHFGAVAVIQPYVGHSFGAGLPTVQWLIVGHMLVISAFLLPMGRLSDLIGRKKVYVGGLAIFSVGALMAGAANSLLLLILFRAFQGIGPAMTIGNQMAILTSVFPPSQRGRAVGLHMTMVGVGLMIGPSLGGLLADTLGWRAVFLIYAPLGLLSLLPALWVLNDKQLRQETLRSRGHRFDWPGAAISALALLAFLLAMTNGPRLGWTSPYILAPLAAWAALIAALLWWEKRNPFPLLNPALFRSSLFSIGVVTRSLNMIAWATPLFLMPFYLQGVAGYSPRDAGLIMTVMVVATAAVAPFVGRLSDRFGPRPFVLGGSALAAAALFLLAGITTSTPLWLLVLPLVMHSSSYALFNVPNSTSIFNAVLREHHGVIGAFLQLLRNVFVVTGISLVTVIVAGTMDARGLEPTLDVASEAVTTAQALGFTAGMRNAFLAMGGLQVLAIVLLLIKTRPSPQPADALPQPISNPGHR